MTNIYFIVCNSGGTTGFTNTTMDLKYDAETIAVVNGATLYGKINKKDIVRHFIDYVYDDLDGYISNSAVTVDIISGTTYYNEDVSGITTIGNCTVNFSVSNRLGQTTTATTLLHVTESFPPDIFFKTGLTWQRGFNPLTDWYTGTNIMNLYNYTESGITERYIIEYFISSVLDAYDGEMDKYNVTVTIESAPKHVSKEFPISYIGEYVISFSSTDESGNNTTISKKLQVVYNETLELYMSYDYVEEDYV